MYQITADLTLVMTAAPTPLVRQNVHFLCIDCKLSNFSVEDCDESIHLPVYCQFTFPHKTIHPILEINPRADRHKITQIFCIVVMNRKKSS